MVGSLEDQAVLLAYLETLLENPALRTGNLKPISLVDGSEVLNEIADFAAEHDSSFCLLPLHEVSYASLAKLGIQDHSRQFFLLAPDLRVAFHATFMQPKDLRLLLEKHFGVGTAQNQRASDSLKVGERLKLSAHSTALSKNSSQLELRSKLLIVFSAECISCAMENHLLQVALHQDALSRLAVSEGRTTALVFSPAFLKTDIQRQLVELGITLPAYMADDLPGIENDYFRSSSLGADVIAIDTDDQARIQNLSPFPDLLATKGTPKSTEDA